jgi:hypothetical protein
VNLDTLIKKALDKGVELRLVDGKVKLFGKAQAVQETLDTLRPHKADVVLWLQAQTPTAWKVLAAEYRAHHFTCPTCICSGQGRGLRCGTGASLWAAYQGGQQ